MENNNIIRSFVSDLLTTKVHLTEGKTVDGKYTIKDSKGEGFINQILLKTSSNAYTVQVLIDKSITYDKPYSFFSTNSEHIDNVSAYLAAGIYYLSFQNLYFQKSFIIRIVSTTSITLTLALVRYGIRDEIYINTGD
ncbi:hypothetical protein LCGC14_1979990 [marine sediment metagenome]|uniref:Uncharacterized protein n=1 Tax=marine sediment metagenome TaxID=412755 RepID=A0A0F9F9L7_9ZZZZ